jgi:hypothetical protein
MAIQGQEITNKVSGDDLRIQRTYTDLPTGIAYPKFYLTIKRRKTDADAAAIVQKNITTSVGPAGQITDNDTAGGSIAMYFDLTPAETILLTPEVEYWMDIQGISSSGQIHTMEAQTKIVMLQGQTDATT